MGAWFRLKEGWLSFFLLLLMQVSVAWSMQGANWAPGLHLLNGVILVALPLGLLLAKTRLPGIVAHLLALLIGAGWITWLAFGLVPEIEGRAEQFVALAIRVIIWVRLALDGGMSADNLIFILEMLIIFWVMNYASAWSLFRSHNIWGVIIPAGTVILINTYYAQQGLSLLLIAFLITAFLLIVRTYLFEQEREWRANGVSFSPDLSFDFLRDGTIFAVAIIILAWVAPTAVESGKFNPWLARMGAPLGAAQQNWNRLFAALNYRSTPGGSWFGRSMTFRGPLQLSDEMVMEVKANGGRYWRAVVFDRYSSAGWAATDSKVVKLDGNTPAIPGVSQSTDQLRSAVDQVYTIFSPGGTMLFAASQPLRVSLPASMLVAGAAAEMENATATALAQLYAAQPLYRGQVYSVTSAVSRADIQSLRAAGADYPAYIAEPYTRLPDTLPQRVRDLAADLTANDETPYDKARTLERYLRSIRYDETIPGPKPGQDGVDYFLFDERAGYCDYYASSMAVMLRSLGIPARVAQGYSQGEIDPTTGAYQVRQRNAHTWVEVYFPTYGWIEFEPTAAEPDLIRPETPDQASNNSQFNPESPTSPLDELERLRRLEEQLAAREAANTPLPDFAIPRINPRDLVLPFSLLLLGGLTMLAGRTVMRRRWAGLSLIERIFDQLVVGARLLGIHQRPAQTPEEYAETVGKTVPPTRSAMERLAALFGRARFSAAPLSPQEEEEANSLWRSVRLMMAKHIGSRWRRPSG